MKLEVFLNANNIAGKWSLGNRQVNLTKTDRAISFKSGALEYYIEGEFYYYLENDKQVIIDPNNIQKSLENVLSKNSLQDIPHVLEGMYVIIAFDSSKGSIHILSDVFNRRNFFYSNNGEQFIVSTELKDTLGKDIKYSQKGLYSYLLLGYAPGNDTFYENVYRLGTDEMITVSADDIKFTANPKVKNIKQYDKSYIDKYEQLITNSVTARASANGNVIMNSGGWDSTSLVYLLTENFDKSKINSVVMEVILSDKQSFNIYEVDKVKRISEHFGIATETVTIDYSNKESVDVWERNIENLKNNHVYFWMHHIKLAEQVGQGIGRGRSVFSGEASDSIHNFGYSQFVSVNYDNLLLREYADKAKSFLYGPTFLGEILDGTFKQDKVFEFFNFYYGAEKFDIPSSNVKRELLNKYLQSFILSYPRVPFAKWKNTNVVKDNLNKEFEEFVNNKYFNDLSDNISQENLYYNLLQVYRRFHFHSAQIAIGDVAFGRFGLSCKVPFLDLSMVDYMYSMPEDWGRGLEIRTTKYPLRYLANERWSKMPLHILEESGPHSYIAENDKKWTYAGGNWDIYCEILYSSVFKDYFKDMFSKVDVEKYFDSNYFDTDKFKKIIKDYLNGVEDIPSHGLLFKLALLFSIGLFENK